MKPEKKINYIKRSQKNKGEKKNINQRDTNFQSEGFIELENSFNKRKKNSKE